MKLICLYSNIILLIFLLSIASAQVQSLPTQKQNSIISIEQTCSSCTYVRVDSIKYPNSTRIYLNVPMTNNGYSYSYLLNDTSQLGTYIVTTCGDVDGINTCVDYDFDVTPSGLLQTTSQGIGSAIYLFLMITLTFLFGYLGFRFIEGKNVWLFGIFLIFLSFLFIFYDVWLGYLYYLNFTGMTDTTMPETMFYIFITIIIVCFIGSLGLLFLRWKEIFKYFKKELKKKDEDDNIDEDMDFI